MIFFNDGDVLLLTSPSELGWTRIVLVSIMMVQRWEDNVYMYLKEVYDLIRGWFEKFSA